MELPLPQEHKRAGRHRRLRLVALALASSLFALALRAPSTPAAAAGAAYYVDCLNGSDANSGLDSSQAWRSLGKANGANLLPGDRLLLARGCTWQGTLRAAWNGTSAARIRIAAYGSGPLPRIQNTPADLLDGAYNAVDITGSYLIIEQLEVTLLNPPIVPECASQPIGFFIGFNFRNPNNLPNGGSYNILRYSRASRMTAGAHFNHNTRDVQLLNNQFVDNHVMSVLTPAAVNPNDDLGAWGVLLKGRNHEVAYNYFADNRAWCAFDTVPHGNAVEVFEAQDSRIHHNTSVNDRVFSELGGSARMRADGLTYAYNLVISSVAEARFIVARGSGNPYGPTPRTQVLNNTVYYTGPASQGIVCGAGCSSSILVARNNLLWAEEKAIYGDAPFTETHNLYWSSNGQPVVQLQGASLSPNSLIANPRFVNPATQAFNLLPSSPAINAGMAVGWAVDLLGTDVPQGSAPDIGAFEYLARPLALELALFLPLIRSGD